MTLKNKKIMLVCSDPGGAQAIVLLYSYLKTHGACVTLIARRSGLHFAGKLRLHVCKNKRSCGNFDSIQRFIKEDKPDFIITGTSEKDDLERNYIKAGRSIGISTLAIIDWWSDYKKRFVHPGTETVCLPDIICVVDDVAKSLFLREVKRKAKIVVTGNPYFSNILSTIKSSHTIPRSNLFELQKSGSNPTILFYAEPIFPDYDQFEIFRRIARGISEVIRNNRKTFKLVIKFHPRGEKREIYKKYEKIIRKELGDGCKAFFVKKQYNATKLMEDADYVWGMCTTPMLEAMLRGKPVSSFLPRDLYAGVPFTKAMRFCPSADDFSQYPGLIRRLLTENKFVKGSLDRQKKYKVTNKDFFSSIRRVLENELKLRSADEKAACN